LDRINKINRIVGDPRAARISFLSTIIAILEASADGTLHLPVPEELRHGKVEVVAHFVQHRAKPFG
jgi:hypothetical protein